MTRRLVLLDRAAVLLVGLALVAGGSAAIAWHQGWGPSWPDAIDTRRFTDLESTAWWPWAFAAAGVVVGLVGLVWLLAHAPRRGEGVTRLGDASDQHGAVRVDLGTVAKAVAADFEARTGASGVRGTARRHGATHVIELRGHLDPDSDSSVVADAAARLQGDLAAAFPDGSTTTRVLLGSARRAQKPTRPGTARVH